MSLVDYLQLGFIQHALAAALVVGVIAGILGPFVAARDMAFALHGAAELAFPCAAAGLVIADDAVGGAFVGSLVVATAFGLLGRRRSERNTSIGVVLAFGLGVGVLLLSQYHGFATQATNILFGNILGVSTADLLMLVVVATFVAIVFAVIYRPLLFSSVDPDVAAARGVRVDLLGMIFLYLLAITVTAVAQVVGTVLVLSLAVTPAAAARRFTASPLRVTALSVAIAVTSAVGGVLLSLEFDQIKTTVFITFISFGAYLAGIATQALRRVR